VSSIDPEEQSIRFTNNRKIDRDAAGGETPPAAGGAADPGSDHDPTPPSGEPDAGEFEARLAERTADLQRLQAEYANYRKRAERDRLAAGDAAIARVAGDFLPVLDDLDRARAHGDLTGALKAVADKLDEVFTKLGLESFGQVGDPFDPSIHEAVLHDVSDDVSVPTATTVMRQGYRHKDRLIRPAMVGVSDPGAPTAEADGSAGADSLTDATAQATAPGNEDRPATSAQPHEDHEEAPAGESTDADPS
jgi:molecular chaperone GrpE